MIRNNPKFDHILVSRENSFGLHPSQVELPWPCIVANKTQIAMVLFIGAIAMVFFISGFMYEFSVANDPSVKAQNDPSATDDTGQKDDDGLEVNGE
jgi:hypothetical protein